MVCSFLTTLQAAPVLGASKNSYFSIEKKQYFLGDLCHAGHVAIWPVAASPPTNQVDNHCIKSMFFLYYSYYSN